MPIEELFKIKRDIAIENIGGFFCQACLVGKAKAAISSDPRYCQDCFDILREERALGSGGSGSGKPSYTKLKGVEDTYKSHGFPGSVE